MISLYADTCSCNIGINDDDGLRNMPSRLSKVKQPY